MDPNFPKTHNLPRTVPLVGDYYRSAIARSLVQDDYYGKLCLLVRDSDNSHDENAIKIVIYDHLTSRRIHSGFVPRGHNIQLAKFMDTKLVSGRVLVGYMSAMRVINLCGVSIDTGSPYYLNNLLENLGHVVKTSGKTSWDVFA